MIAAVCIVIPRPSVKIQEILADPPYSEYHITLPEAI